MRNPPPPKAFEVPTAQPQAPAKRRSELFRRFVTGIVAVPTILALIIWAPQGYGLLFFVLLVCGGAFAEYLRMARIGYTQPIAIVTYLITFTLFGLAWAHYTLGQSLAVFFPLLMFLFPVLGITVMFEPHNKRPFQQIGLLVVGVIYIAIPLVLFFVAGFRGANPGPHTMFDLAKPAYYYDWQRPIGILFCIWMSDTAAYFAGKAFGKHPVWPRISPGKTWQGFAGGLLGTLGLAFVLERWLTNADVDWHVVAGIVVVFGLLGDLLESLLKRTVHKKDSGGILPGHGGVLDRFDGFFLAMPFVSGYLYSVAVGTLGS